MQICYILFFAWVFVVKKKLTNGLQNCLLQEILIFVHFQVDWGYFGWENLNLREVWGWCECCNPKGSKGRCNQRIPNVDFQGCLKVWENRDNHKSTNFWNFRRGPILPPWEKNNKNKLITDFRLKLTAKGNVKWRLLYNTHWGKISFVVKKFDFDKYLPNYLFEFSR